jgi:hypothetical protein
MVNEVNNILDSAAHKCGMTREKFVENKVPEEYQKIHVIIHYGEFDHVFVFNNLIYPELKNTHYKDKYVILVTWNGFGNIITGVDEVWSLKNHDVNEKLYEKANGLRNYSDTFTIIIRNLNEHFRNVVKVEKFENIFNHGYNFNYFRSKNKINVVKKQTNNVNYLNKLVIENILGLSPNSRVFLIPFKFIRTIINGKIVYYKISSNFWSNIVNRFLEKDFGLVLLKNSFTHDMSGELVNRKNICMIHDHDWLNVVSYIKQTGLFVDMFSGLSCFAQYANCENLTLVERSFYNQMNLNQIEDLISSQESINRKHYSFFQFFAEDPQQSYLYVDQLLRILKKIEIKSEDIRLAYSINLDEYLKSRTKKFYKRFIGYKKINERA